MGIRNVEHESLCELSSQPCLVSGNFSASTKMSHEIQGLVGGSANGGYDLELIYREAVDQLQSMRDTGQLSSVDYDMITSTSKPGEALLPMEKAIAKLSEQQLSSSRISASVVPLMLRLERFSAAIDMVMQVSPQLMGVSLLGLVWGSIRFLLVVSYHTRLLSNPLLIPRR